MKKLNDTEVVPELYKFPIRCYKPNKIGAHEVMHYMLHPHEWVGHLYLRKRELFNKCFVGSAGDLVNYWRHELQLEWTLAHPVLDPYRDLSAQDIPVYPVNFHGDGARYVNKRKIIVISITGALCKLFGLLGRLVVTVVPEEFLLWKLTLEQIYARIVWSFECLATGIWPWKDFGEKDFDPNTFRHKHRGEHLVGGFKFVLDGTLADLEFYVDTFEVDGYRNDDMCHLCGASKTNAGRLYTRTGPLASWQATRKTHQEFEDKMNQMHKRPELSRLPGLHLSRFFLCGLHTVEQGTAGHFAGSCMWELVCYDLWWAAPGRQQENRKLSLARAYAAFMKHCKDHKVSVNLKSFSEKTLNKKSAKSYAYFKAKAWETKVVSKWLADVVIAANDGSDHGMLRAACAWGLKEYYAVVDDGPVYLPPHDLHRLQRGVCIFLKSYLALTSEAVRQHRYEWHWVPKHHMHEHIADVMAPQRNPRTMTTYGGEDLVGRIGKLAGKCHKRDVVRSVLQRYLVLMGYHWGLFG